MEKAINNLLAKPVYIYIFGLFFLVSKTALFFGAFQLSVFVGFLFTYILVNFLLITILKKFELYKYGVSWVLLLWIIFFYGPTWPTGISLLLKTDKFYFKYFAIAWVIICLFYIWVSSLISYQIKQTVRLFFTVFLLILTGTTIITGIYSYQQEIKYNDYVKSRKIPRLKSKRDIIWILLDEYAAPVNLRSQFGFNDPLVDSLKAKHFFVTDSLTSRNTATIHSINSLFNLDDSIPASDYIQAADHLKKSLWVTALKKRGYTFINYDFLNISTKSKFQYVHLFPDNYKDQILHGTMVSFMDDFFNRGRKKIDVYNQTVIDSVLHKVQEKNPSPYFIWCHLLIPHPPFYRDAAGNFNSTIIDEPDKASANDVRKQYTNYVLYSNSVVLKILNTIPDWKNKNIIISGDHGARMLQENDMKRSTRTFAAIYYPGISNKDFDSLKFMQQIPFYLH